MKLLNVKRENGVPVVVNVTIEEQDIVDAVVAHAGAFLENEGVILPASANVDIHFSIRPTYNDEGTMTWSLQGAEVVVSIDGAALPVGQGGSGQ